MPPFSNLVFFGSGPVAVATLTALKTAGFVFEAIITKPRAPGFRGDVPVVDLARAWNVRLLTPQTKAELSEIVEQAQLSSHLGLVVDYGLIINKDVIDSFPLGIVNSHFSLLPQWRGADPITFALLSGQQTTGVSLMLINEKMDEGLLIAQKSYDIPADCTIQQLTQGLIALSNRMLVRYLPTYLQGKLQPYRQSNQPPTYSRKLQKEDGRIDWTKPASALEREVRAYLGWPKSYSRMFGRDIVITKARVATDQNDGDLVISCGDQTWLAVQELTAPSGRKMSGADFLRGYKKS